MPKHLPPLRRPALALLALAMLAAPARADVAQVVSDHALPGYARLTAATAALAAEPGCDPNRLRPLYHKAFDAWLAVAHLRLGPVEDEGRVLAIAFWPDPKGLGQKAQAALLAAADPAVLAPDRMREQSVAARGLFGLERLLYPAAPLTGDYACALIHANAADLARMAAEIEAGWHDGFAAALTAPGPGGRYLTETEARQALLTALVTGLEFNADQRLGRPLGTFDKPRPERAEARASGRSLRDVQLSLLALRQFAQKLLPQSPQTQAAFDKALTAADRLQDPTLAGVADPQNRLKIEILAQDIHAIRDAVLAEMAPALGVSVGFNAADGD